MKLTKYLLFIGILNLNASNKVIFLYDSKILNKESKYIYQEIYRQKSNIEKIKINKKWIKNDKKDLLKSKILNYFEEYNKKIDIIATGLGINILKELIEFYNQIKINPINKVIIIGSKILISDKSLFPYSKKNTYYGIPEKPIRKLYIAKKALNSKGYKLKEAITEEILFTENDDAFSESDKYLTGDEFSSNELKSIKDKPEPNLNHAIILINTDEYLKFLEQEKADNSCLGWCKKKLTVEKVAAILSIVTTILSLLAT